MTDIAVDERRDYYRINDTVGLTYSVCKSVNDVPSQDEFIEEVPDEFQLISHLTRIDMDSSSLLHSIQDVSPDICRYLKIINAKIETLARHIVNVGLTDEFSTHKVTLSAGGLSFISEKEIPRESIIRAQMVLYPSCSGILTYGKIVRCDVVKDSNTPQFDIAMEYLLINETDRDSLVRHVLQLQSNLLRQKT